MQSKPELNIIFATCKMGFWSVVVIVLVFFSFSNFAKTKTKQYSAHTLLQKHVFHVLSSFPLYLNVCVCVCVCAAALLSSWVACGLPQV